MRTPDFSGLWQRGKKVTLSIALTAIATITLFLFSDLAVPQSAAAYPFWAQQTAPETPREATGRIVCANCHSGQKPAEIEIPQSVLPDTVFEAVVKIPYDLSSQQVLADGSKVSARPSGTEPKIKFYVSVNAALSSAGDFDGTFSQLQDKVKMIQRDLNLV
jgi:phosphomannomutase